MRGFQALFSSKGLNRAVLLVLLLAFTLGMGRLLLLRFKAGDVFPPYSTLRSDPLGTKAFYEGLKALGSVSVKRNYESFSRMDLTENSGLFFLGTWAYMLDNIPEETADLFEEFVLNGGNLVIAYHPEKPVRPRKVTKDEKARDGADGERGQGKDGSETEERGVKGSKPDDPEKGEDKDGEDEREFPSIKRVSLEERWGFIVKHAERKAFKREAQRVSRPGYKNLPVKIPWNSALYFHEIEDPWRPVYTRGGSPVIMERPLGRGRLTMSADSYLLSNEAMSRERYPRLLAWFVGNSNELVFDETHLGSGRSPGIMSLAWEYNLYWLALGLLFVSGLFIWKNSSHFVPPLDEYAGENETVLSGRDSTNGLISLLRRSFQDKDILEICYREWCGHFMPKQGFLSDKAERIKAELDAGALGSKRKKDPVGTYKAMCKILSRRVRL
jgi:hypothetical protein